MSPQQHDDRRGGLSRSTWVLLGFAAVAAYFLLAEHRAHAVQYLPFGLLLACLLMHFFHGHGRHGGGTHGTPRGPNSAARPRNDSGGVR